MTSSPLITIALSSGSRIVVRLTKVGRRKIWMRRRLGSIFRSSGMGHSTPSRSLGSWPLPQCCLSHHPGSRHPHRRRSGWSQGWALYWSVETQSSSGQNWWIAERRGSHYFFVLMRALLIPYPINIRYSYNTYIFSAEEIAKKLCIFKQPPEECE